MVRLLPAILLIAIFIVAGCDKDEDMEALEKEASQDKAAAVMDSLDQQKTTDTVETTEKPQQAPEGKDNKTDGPTHYTEDRLAQLEGYVVQVGSYYDYEFAAKMADLYEKRGYPAFVKRVELDDGTYYRLRIGVYETREEAKQVADILKDHYSAEYWIDYNR